MPRLASSESASPTSTTSVSPRYGLRISSSTGATALVQDVESYAAHESETTRQGNHHPLEKLGSFPVAFVNGGVVVAVVALILSICCDFVVYITSRHEDYVHHPRVDVGYAIYEGRSLDNGVDQYLGMRYAAPPVGDLRWRAPQDPEITGSVESADEWGYVCYGTDHGMSEGENEDCLFVNVWTPSDATRDSKLPVWVFIQGGGYTHNSNANYNGSGIVEESDYEVILVDFNYRAGLWGFLAGEAVREDGDLNAGLLDQRHLLTWVRKHILKFGGDPNQVVIHGQSAGAGSVAHHLTAYGGRNYRLFAGAISQSVFLPAEPSVDELEYQFNRTLDSVGCDSATMPMSCLRNISTRKLQTIANSASPFPGRASNPKFYWTPCVDGYLIRDVPSAMFKKGKFVKVPFMAGTTTDEGSVFAADAATPGHVKSFMQDNFPRLNDSEATDMLAHYPLQKRLPDHNSWFPSSSGAYGEATFICPSNFLLDAFTSHGIASQTWAYRFNVQDRVSLGHGLGVVHGADLPAIFGPENCPSPQSYYSYNRPVVNVMMKYYISFVRALDPNLYRYEHAGLPEWESWGKSRKRLRIQLLAEEMECVEEGERRRCEFWEGISGSLQH